MAAAAEIEGSVRFCFFFVGLRASTWYWYDCWAFFVRLRFLGCGSASSRGVVTGVGKLDEEGGG